MSALPSFMTKSFGAGIFGRGDVVSQTEVLRDVLGAYGIAASEEQLSLLVRHLELLARKNEVMNLTTVSSVDKGLITHVLDSLLPLPSLCSLVTGDVPCLLDIGTGGGFPGLPLAIMMGWNSTLIDSVGKKVKAVEEFIQELELDGHVRALHERAEDFARKEPASYDVIVTRAVAQTNVLIEYATPLLKHGGLLVAYKANLLDEELSVAARAASICGLSFVSRETFDLPNQSGHRELLYYAKTGKAHIKLPRRPGLAKNSPLGL